MSNFLLTLTLPLGRIKSWAAAFVLLVLTASMSNAQSLLVCPPDGEVNCLSDVPGITAPSASDAGYESVDVVYSDVVISGTDCDYTLSRTWTVTFTSPENTLTETCTAVFRVADLQAPIFSGAPADAAYQCLSDVPAYVNLEASDACGSSVVVEQFGSLSSADYSLVCNEITTPQGPGQDWGLWINGLLNAGLASSDWYRWVGTPSLVFTTNGGARLTGDVVALNNPSNGWHVDMTLAEGVDWATWSAGGGLYMDSFGTNGATHTSWNFFKLVTTISRLEGFGSFEGDQLVLSHQPASYVMGFQFGNGANNRNGNNGGSGWFFYDGHVNGQSVSGNGDVTLDMNCDDPNQPNEACFQTIERRWAARDACGNVAYHNQVITVNDTTPPVFTGCPANIEVACATDVPAPVSASSITAEDNCGGEVIVTYLGSETDTISSCNFVITHLYSASDLCGNRSNCSYTISVNDSTAPVLSVPSSYTAECDKDIILEVASATDNCTADLTIIETVDTTASGCVVTYVRSFSVSDACGNVSSGSQTITVNDTTAPELTIPADYTVECNASVVFEAASAFDNCLDGVGVIETADTIYNGCVITYIRSFSASDACGNTSTGVQTINVIDTTAPVLTIPADYSVQCFADVVFEDASATDNCTEILTISTETMESNAGDDCNYSFVRTFTVADNCGNTSTGTQTITVVDTEAPEFDGAAGPFAVECGDIYNEQWTMPSASDNCDNSLDYSYTDFMTSGGCLGTIIRSITITDNCGNSTTQEFYLSIQDTTAPVIESIPGDTQAECGSVPALPSVDSVVAFDNCGDATTIYGSYTEGLNANVIVTVEEQIVSGDCAGRYTILWIWTATDYCGNSASDTTTISVVDTTPPVFTSAPENLNLHCSAVIPAAEVLTAVDGCNNAVVEASVVETTTAGACAANYTIERVYTATDVCGNSSSVTQLIVVTDTQSPVFSTDNATSFTYECDEVVAVITPLVSDDCSEFELQYADVTTGDVCATYIARTWTASDACGNSSSFVQNISVLDTEAPTAEFDVQINRPCDDAAGIYATALDNCDTDVQIEIVSETAVSGGCAGSFIRLYVATDNCGNATEFTQYITLVDVVAPVAANQPEDLVIECGNEVPSFDPAWTDNCTEDLIVTFDAQTSVVDCVTIIEETYTATDACDNTKTLTRRIEIIDTTNPYFVDFPSNLSLECSDEIPAAGGVVAMDVCDNDVTVISADVVIPGSCNGSYVIERVYRGFDDCGNQVVETQTITVTDQTAPVFAASSTEFTYECNTEIPVVTPSANDNCSEVSLTYSDSEVVGNSCSSSFNRVWTATDECGNASNLTQVITIVDTTAPAIAGSLEIDRPCDDFAGNYVEVIDNCSEYTISYTEDVASGSCAGIIIRTYTATDACGNISAEFEQVINLIDAVSPTVTSVAENMTVECGSEYMVAPAAFADNCDAELDVVSDFTSETDGCTTVETYTWTATDHCGNSTTATTVVTIVDTTNPYFVSLPESVTLNCDQEIPGFGEYTAADNCDNEVDVAVAEEILPGACPQSYTIARTYRGFDNCGNSVVETVYIYILDELAPTFGEQSDSYTYNCGEEIPVVEPSATDNCGEVVLSYVDSETSGNTCATYFNRVWTASDECGNSSTFVQTITIIDTEAPVFDAAIQITRPCDDYLGVYATAFDNCSASVSVVSVVEDMLSSGGCQGTIVRTYGAFDDCGNYSEFTQYISLTDVVAPVCTNTPEPIVVECGNAIPEYTPNWTDNCDDELTLTEESTTEVVDCSTIITTVYTAADNCDNTTSVTRVVTIVDTTSPEVTGAPENINVDCAIFNGTPMFASLPEFTDACDTDLTITSNVTEEVVGCNRVYTYTWTATDDCNNSTSVTAIMTVYDNTAPEFVSVPQGGSYSCDETFDYGMAEAFDLCGFAEVTYNEEVIQGSCPQSYSIVRTWVATDDCGNTSSAQTTYVITDSTAPVFVDFPADVYLQCIEGDVPVSSATAVDNCDLSVDVTSSDVVVYQNSCQYTIERTFVATDDCGNSTVASQFFYVNDTTAPTITGDATVTITCEEYSAESIYVSATDNCNTATITVVGNAPYGDGCLSVVRSYQATDECGNIATFDQIIIVTDTEAPVASEIPSNFTVGCTDAWTPAVVTFTDNCDADLTVSENVEVTGDVCYMVYHYTWSATDNCNNTTMVEQFVTVSDEVAPVFEMESSSITVDCGAQVSMPVPTAVDNCGGEVTITSTQEVIDGACPSNYTVITTYTASDICGNTSTMSVSVTYVDNVAPTWSSENASSYMFECGDEVSVVIPMATDNCSTISYDYIDGSAVSNGCTESFVRTWIATDACGNSSLEFTQLISFEDTTDPVLSGCPEDLTLACDAEVPAPADVTAIDNCTSDITVSMVETCIGCPAELTSFDLYTPARPANNPCSYPCDWAMALFGFDGVNSQFRWYQIDTTVPAQITYNSDGSVTLSGRLFNVVHPDGGFDFNVVFANAKTWEEWNSDATPSSFKADCGGLDANYQDWMYYILQGGSSVELTGWGVLAGSALNVNHAPVSQYFGFQLGEGANNYNADYGMGGWFSYSGVFLYQGEPLMSGMAAGVGDFAFGIDNCPDYSIVRTWTAIDCSGNTTSCSQTILFTSPDAVAAPVANADETSDNRSNEISIVGIQPNPATNRSMITFMSEEAGKLTLEVLDMTGRVVGSLFNSEVLAGVPYTADFNAEQLSSGLYMVRLSSASKFDIERMQIQK